MNEKRRLSHNEVDHEAHLIAQELKMRWEDEDESMRLGNVCYPIPRGGIPAAYIVRNHWSHMAITDNPNRADFFIDDIVDSGATYERYKEKYGKPFFALIDKTRTASLRGTWIEFPWEGDVDSDMETTITRLLQQIGEDPKRGGLLETPSRVARAWADWTCGYSVDPKDVLKVFADGGESYDEMIVVRDLVFYSHCEHHMAPFFGTADIGYIPNGKIVGLSKLSRLLDVFAKRLQVQERLTAQVADAIMDHLNAKGAAVSIKARHLCMESRGIHKQGSETVTNVMRGVFFDDSKARSEFLAMTR